jgi:hypothetical protein
MHCLLALFQIYDGRLDPFKGKGIEQLFGETAVLSNLTLQFVALLAHGSPA